MIEQLEHILVGFDFSSPAMRAVQIAGELARETGAAVKVVCVIDDRVERYLDRTKTDRTERLADLERRVRTLVSREVSEPDVELARGRPFKRILEAAAAHGSGLIVVGATGSGGFERWLLGSTAERVARKSRVPVLVVEDHAPWPPGRIMCPLDLTDSSVGTAATATQLARRFGARLFALHVRDVDGPFEMELMGLLTRREMLDHLARLERDAKRTLEPFFGPTGLVGVDWKAILTSGNPHREIIASARDTRAELMVMSRRGKGRLADTVLGRTSERVLRRSPCSLLLV